MPVQSTFEATPFRVHPLFSNQHAQTILSTFLPRSFPEAAAWRAAGEERLFELPDGDRLLGVLHRHPDDPQGRRPLVLLLHGLEGDIDATYVQGMSVKAWRLGYNSLRLNFRNCGNTEHLAHRIYSSMMLDDIDAVLLALAAEGWPTVIPVGVSMSANMLLALLARYGDAPPAPVIGAVAISPPIDQTLVSEAFNQGFNRIYDAYFLVKLRARMARKAKVSPAGHVFAEQAAIAQRVKNLREFDDAITSAAGGFTDAMDYYRQASAGDRLGQIRVPTLLIHAQDDPFLPYAMFQAREDVLKAHPAITTVFPAHGGHVGFIEPAWVPQPEPWMDEYWAENQALAYTRWLVQRPVASPPAAT